MRKLNMVVNTLDKKAHINREIYGHFSEHLGACIYDGIYVGENSKIKYVISDKNVSIGTDIVLNGTENNLLNVEKDRIL